MNKCIDESRVPCEKVRAYMKKEGLLCPVPAPKTQKKRKKKSLFEEWFG